MSDDDPTKDLSDEPKRTTQPTITAVFELVREVKQGLDSTNARLVELSEEVKTRFTRLEDKIDRGSSHGEAEYHDLRRRMRELESKIS